MSLLCQNPECNKPLNKNQIKFCSKRCASKINNIGKILSEKTRKKISISNNGTGTCRIYTCLNCGKKTHNEKFCSNICRGEYQRNILIEQWLKGKISGTKKSGHASYVKHYLLKKYNNKCARCGWGETNPYTKRIPLEVEHIDGNAYNNTPENVILLCPNCQSLTKTYRGANKGHGRREYLKKYYIKDYNGNIISG